jgi:hypothetical protein
VRFVVDRGNQSRDIQPGRSGIPAEMEVGPSAGEIGNFLAKGGAFRQPCAAMQFEIRSTVTKLGDHRKEGRYSDPPGDHHMARCRRYREKVAGQRDQQLVTECDVAANVVVFAYGPEIPNDGVGVAACVGAARDAAARVVATLPDRRARIET